MRDLDDVLEELTRACRDAGIEPGSAVLFAVDAPRPVGTTPIAYLNPAGFVWPDTVAVFRAAGRERVQEYHLAAHRFAIWRDLPGIPGTALGPMLRHELAHARRWELSGTRFFEADELLRGAVRDAGGEGYTSLPSEREANAASAEYAARILAPLGVSELRGLSECSALVTGAPVPDDIVAATVAALEARPDWAPWLDEAGRGAYLDEVRWACSWWDEEAARRLVSGRAAPEVHGVAAVEAVP
ncbi:MAG TPA: hypothetical protein VG265_09535 [Gaiellaceae bacterium]|jgi:hypothetical protein|nr:hypothetical protein [Gaiellaceae bacterium]